MHAQEGLADFQIAFVPEKGLDQDHLAEYGRSLGQSQGGVEVQKGLLAGQIKVDAVAHFVGQGQGVEQIPRVVQKQVGMQGRGKSGAKSPAVFPFADPRLHPLLFKEFSGDPAKEGMKSAERSKKKILRLGQRDFPVPAG